jgi:putative membrane protein
MAAVLAYAHTLAMIALGAMLLSQLLAFDRLTQREEVIRFVRFSVVAAVAAAVMLASGLALLFLSPQGLAHFLRNPVFYIKLAVFAAMLLIAITPARIILLWNRGLDAATLPDPGSIMLVRRYLTVEGILFVVVPLAASLAAYGIGLQSGSN